MSEDRKIFPMESALEVIANKADKGTMDFLSFVVQRPLCDTTKAVVTPMVKGWLYSLQPEFAQMPEAPDQGYGIWLDEQKKRFGDNVSILPMAAADLKELYNLLDSMDAMKEAIAEKDAAIADLTEQLKVAEPFKAKAEKLEKNVETLEEKSKGLNEEVGKLKAEVAGFAGKIAINETDLEQSVKDLVSRAVKDALASLPVGAAGAAVAAGDGAEAAPVEEEGGVPDSFGFGASGSDSDGFGF